MTTTATAGAGGMHQEVALRANQPQEPEPSRDARMRTLRLPVFDGFPWRVASVSRASAMGSFTTEDAVSDALPGLSIGFVRGVPDCLVITHVASGYRVVHVDVLDFPIIGADILLALREAGDWTVTAEQIAADPTVTRRLATAADEVRVITGDSRLTKPYSITLDAVAPRATGSE